MQKEELNWLDKVKTYSHCPKCKKGLLDTRVPRAPLVKLLFFWKDLKRYRCNNCGAKVYVSASQ